MNYKQQKKEMSQSKNQALVSKLVDIAQYVFEQLGHGHSEAMYHRAMEIELRNNNIPYEYEKRVAVTFEDSKGHKNTIGINRLDFFVDNSIIVELKATSKKISASVHRQMFRYCRELEKSGVHAKAALAINFYQPVRLGSKKEILFEDVFFDN